MAIVAFMSISATAQDNTIYDKVEVMPEYKGGTEMLMKFMCDNLQYPQDALEQGKEGRVLVQFVIEKDGSVSDYKVVKGISPSLDAEAMRVAKMIPNKWVAGKNKGKAVRCHFTIPVVFGLR